MYCISLFYLHTFVFNLIALAFTACHTFIILNLKVNFANQSLFVLFFKMSTNKTNQQQNTSSSLEDKPRPKPCCACPETKQVRDAWWVSFDTKLRIQFLFLISYFIWLLISIIEKGEENCQALIEAHKKCMRDLGFNI